MNLLRMVGCKQNSFESCMSIGRADSRISCASQCDRHSLKSAPSLILSKKGNDRRKCSHKFLSAKHATIKHISIVCLSFHIVFINMNEQYTVNNVKYCNRGTRCQMNGQRADVAVCVHCKTPPAHYAKTFHFCSFSLTNDEFSLSCCAQAKLLNLEFI